MFTKFSHVLFLLTFMVGCLVASNFMAEPDSYAATVPPVLVISEPNVTTVNAQPGQYRVMFLPIPLKARIRTVLNNITLQVLGSDGPFVKGLPTSQIQPNNTITGCALIDATNGALITAKKPLSNAGVVSFGKFKYEIPALSSNTKILLYCDLANTNAGNPEVSDYYYARIPTERLITGEFFPSEAYPTESKPLLPGSIQFGQYDVGINRRLSHTVVVAPPAFVASPEAPPLAVSLDSTSFPSTIVLGASTSVPVATYRIDAPGEAVTVRKITLTNCLTNTPDQNGNCADEGEEMGNDMAISEVRLSYTGINANQTAVGTQIVRGMLTNGHAVFDNLQIPVPANGSALVNVLVDTNSVGEIGAPSGARFQLNLNAVGLNQGSFQAVGLTSSAVATEADVNTYALAKPMELRKSKPTFNLSTGSPSGYDDAPLMGMNTYRPVFRVIASTDTRGYTSLQSLLFKVTAFDSDGTGWNLCKSVDENERINASDKWRLTDYTDPSVTLAMDDSVEFFNANGSPCQPGEELKYVKLTLANDINTGGVELGAGETKTYNLRVSFHFPTPSENDSIRIEIPTEAEVNALPNPLDSVLWSDGNEATGIDASLLRQLPVVGHMLYF